jgi:hypothetical protein
MTFSRTYHRTIHCSKQYEMSVSMVIVLVDHQVHMDRNILYNFALLTIQLYQHAAQEVYNKRQ